VGREVTWGNSGGVVGLGFLGREGGREGVWGVGNRREGEGDCCIFPKGHRSESPPGLTQV